MTRSVTATVTESPIADPALYRNIAPLDVRGVVTNASSGSRVEVVLLHGTVRVATATAAVAATGAYSASQPIPRLVGAATVRATLTQDSATTSGPITVLPAYVWANAPRSIDPILSTTITGNSTPKMPRVRAQVQRWNRSTWYDYASTTVSADGRFSVPLKQSAGRLGAHSLRVLFGPPGTPQLRSGNFVIERKRWSPPVITATTAAEVRTTYCSGCPVPPSRLRTIRINYQSSFPRPPSRPVQPSPSARRWRS